MRGDPVLLDIDGWRLDAGNEEDELDSIDSDGIDEMGFIKMFSFIDTFPSDELLNTTEARRIDMSVASA